jgi:hypothetical protein
LSGNGIQSGTFLNRFIHVCNTTSKVAPTRTCTCTCAHAHSAVAFHSKTDSLQVALVGFGPSTHTIDFKSMKLFRTDNPQLKFDLLRQLLERNAFVKEWVVLRRYKEFQRLKEAARIGATIPPKKSVGRFSQKTVEARRMHFEQFLCTCIQVLGTSSNTRTAYCILHSVFTVFAVLALFTVQTSILRISLRSLLLCRCCQSTRSLLFKASAHVSSAL